jgi:hypothetical protein
MAELEAYEAEDEYKVDDDLDQLLKKAKRYFQQSVDHMKESHIEAHRALRFYHNSELDGQWERDDITYLREEGRPAFSFNIIAPKVDGFLGFYADAERVPTIVGSGGEDQLLAEVMNAVAEQVLQDAKYDRISARQIKTGAIAGDCSIHVEVEPDPRGRGWVKVNLYRILPFEVHWDAGSIEPDRCDARCVFWDRWMTKDEFAEAYPDQADAFNSTAGMASAETESTIHHFWSESDDTNNDFFDDYDDENLSRYYYDRHANRCRVIRYEYKEFVEEWTATDERTGQSVQVGEEEIERIQHAIALGIPISLSSQNVERVKVLEFVGSQVLAQYDQAGPFEGFSIVPFTYAMDEETATPYGIVRNLFDPQMELNKSKSLEIEHIAQSVAVGTTAEKGAITDEDQYSKEVRRAGGIAIVEKNALVEGRVQDRLPTPPNMAVTQRAMSAVDLLNEISGMPSAANITPGEAAQAGVTVAIRYNKARQAVSQPFGNFEDAQISVVRRVAEIISRAMPDDQIEALLSAEGRYQFQDGMVIEMGASPDGSGQQVPVARAELRNIRNLHHNIELENTSDNSTLRMIEFQSLTQLQQAGVPVDPEVLVETATNSRSTRERLKAYVEQSQAQAAQAAQAEQQAQQEQIQMLAQTEMAKSQVNAQKNQITARDNEVRALLERRDQDIDASVAIAKILAEADEAEKQRIYDVIREVRSQQLAVA